MAKEQEENVFEDEYFWMKRQRQEEDDLKLALKLQNELNGENAPVSGRLTSPEIQQQEEYAKQVQRDWDLHVSEMRAAREKEHEKLAREIQASLQVGEEHEVVSLGNVSADDDAQLRENLLQENNENNIELMQELEAIECEFLWNETSGVGESWSPVREKNIGERALLDMESSYLAQDCAFARRLYHELNQDESKKTRRSSISDDLSDKLQQQLETDLALAEELINHEISQLDKEEEASLVLAKKIDKEINQSAKVEREDAAFAQKLHLELNAAPVKSRSTKQRSEYLNAVVSPSMSSLQNPRTLTVANGTTESQSFVSTNHSMSVSDFFNECLWPDVRYSLSEARALRRYLHSAGGRSLCSAKKQGLLLLSEIAIFHAKNPKLIELTGKLARSVNLMESIIESTHWPINVDLHYLTRAEALARLKVVLSIATGWGWPSLQVVCGAGNQSAGNVARLGPRVYEMLCQTLDQNRIKRVPNHKHTYIVKTCS